MPTTNRTSVWVRPVGYLSLLFLMFLVAGLFFVSYSVCVFFLLPLIWRPLVDWLMNLTAIHERRGYWGWVLTLVVIPVLILLAIILPPLSLPRSTSAVAPPALKVYRAVIEPMDPSLEKFKLNEEAVTNPDWTRPTVNLKSEALIRLPERDIISTSKGFFLREVRIAPLQADSSGRVALTLPDGNLLGGFLCGYAGTESSTYTCPQSHIQLLDFPVNSFYLGKNTESQTVQKYVDTETITWTAPDLAQGIVFAYVRPPFQYLRPILTPFLETSSLGESIFVALGIIGSIVLVPSVKSVLPEIYKWKLASWFQKRTKEPREKAKLVVSAKGEEKEVQVTDAESH